MLAHKQAPLGSRMPSSSLDTPGGEHCFVLSQHPEPQDRRGPEGSSECPGQRTVQAGIESRN